MTRPSASSNLGASSFTTSSKTQRPFSKHFPQPMQPLMSLFPMQTVSVSIPSLRNVSSISFRAIEVFPLGCGLPLMISTFMSSYS